MLKALCGVSLAPIPSKATENSTDCGVTNLPVLWTYSSLDYLTEEKLRARKMKKKQFCCSYNLFIQCSIQFMSQMI